MTHQEFQNWAKVQSDAKHEPLPWEPVGSFELAEDAEEITVNLTFIRSSKYILLKPTSVRTQESSTSVPPVELQFFGATGSLVREETHSTAKGSSSNANIAQNTEVAIEGLSENGSWVSLHTVNHIPITNIVNSKTTQAVQNLGVEVLAGVPLWGSFTQTIANDSFFQQRVTRLRVKVLKAGNKSSWTISGVTVKGYTSSEVTSGSLNAAPASPAVLRHLLLNSREFG